MIKEKLNLIHIETFEKRWQKNKTEKVNLKYPTIILSIFIIIHFICRIFFFSHNSISVFIDRLFAIWIVPFYIFILKECYIYYNNNQSHKIKKFVEIIDVIIDALVFVLCLPIAIFLVCISKGKISILRSIKYFFIIFITSIILFYFFGMTFLKILYVIFNYISILFSIDKNLISDKDLKIFSMILFIHSCTYLMYFIQKHFAKNKDETLLPMYNHIVYLMYFLLLFFTVFYNIWVEYKDSIINVSTIMLLLTTIFNNISDNNKKI